MQIKFLLVLFWIVFFVKTLVYIVLINYGHEIFGGGNDADSYNNYALGYDVFAVNLWSDILRFLNEFGIYNRVGIKFFLAFIGFLVIPFVFAAIAVDNNKKYNKNYFWFAALVVSSYPTILYFTLDIYRDVFVIFIFLLALFFVRCYIESKNFMLRFYCFFIILYLSYLLFGFRNYLGIAFLFAFLTFYFLDFKKVNLMRLSLAFIALINIFFSLGMFDLIILYRSLFNEMEGAGSNLGIVFDSKLLFSYNFIKSFIFQMVGLFFSNASAAFVFLVESLPFIFFFVYSIRNRQYSTKFVDFLILFFVAYATIWLIGNDNLGTAARLRVYNYLSVFLIFLIIYQRKNIFSSLVVINGLVTRKAQRTTN